MIKKTLLTLDNGNTNPHVGLFEGDELVSITPVKDFDFKKHVLTPMIVSSVGKTLQIPKEPTSIKVLPKLNHGMFLDMPVNYAETLGEDRLVQSYYLFKTRKKDCLFIDCGTFFTINYINEHEFVGGFIFPGVKPFLMSYSEGANLPILNLTQEIIDSPVDMAHTTNDAILNAAKIYLGSTIGGLLQTTKGDVVLSGGNAGVLSKMIAKSQKFEVVPHLIHHALKYTLPIIA